MAETKVNSQGASAAELDAGQTVAGAPKAPAEPSNSPPAKPVDAVAQAATDKVAAETKATADATAATQAAADATKAATKPEEWPSIADQGLSSAANVMKDAGLSYTDTKAIFAKAVQSGKVEDIDITALETKIGKDKAALAMIGVKDYYARQTAATQETIKQVYTIVGGEAAYTKVKDWATQKAAADPEFAKDLDKYRSMFDAGGVTARAAAVDLLRQYNLAPNTSGVSNRMVTGDTTVGVDKALQPLSRLDYIEQLKEAHKKGDRAAVQRLDAQRRAGIKAKI